MRVKTALSLLTKRIAQPMRLSTCALTAAMILLTHLAAASNSVESCLAGQGDWDDRIVVCTEAIDADGLDDSELSAAYRERGRAYTEIGEVDAAISDLTSAIALDQKHIESWTLRGDLYLSLERFDEAQSGFVRALRRHPNNFKALWGCMRALEASGLPNDERSFREQCTDLASDGTQQADVDPAGKYGQEVVTQINRLGGYNMSGDWYRAADAFVRAYKINPDAVLCLWQADWAIDGYVLRQYDMLTRPDIYNDRALSEILYDSHKVLWDMSDDPTLLRERALLFADSGGMFHAVDDLDAALALEPSSIELMVMSTKARIDVLTSGPLIYRFLDDVRRYVAVDLMSERIERAMELGADDFLTRLTYAEVLGAVLRDNDEPSAIEQQIAAYDRVVELLVTWPDHPAKWLLASEIYLTRSGLWRNLGDEDRAMEDFDSAFLSPDDSKRRWDELCRQP